MKRRAKRATKSVSKGIRFAPDVLRSLQPIAKVRGFSAAVNEAIRERGAMKKAEGVARRKAS